MSRLPLATAVGLALVLLAGPSPAADPGAPFDLRAMRAAHPGATSVLLEHEVRVSRPEPHILRLATRSTRAVLDDVGSADLGLFSADERPGCRTPAGVRIEVQTPGGETLVTTMDDLVRLVTDPFAVWKGPRKGLATGALVHEAYHVDYDLRCTGGVGGVSRRFGSSVPVLVDRVIVECPTCSVDVAGPGEHAFTEADGRKTLELTDVQPSPKERFGSTSRPRWYVGTSPDPLAWGRVLAEQLPEQSRRWARHAGAWASWAREQAAGMKDKDAALAYGLSRIRVHRASSVWEFGADWGEPTAPESRTLRPLEWLALANQLLGPKGGVPVLFNDSRAEVPQGACSVFDWDEYGVLLPKLGLTSTAQWSPMVAGMSSKLAGTSAVTLTDEPALRAFVATPDTRSRHADVRVESSGIASLLVRVQATDRSDEAQEQRERWERAEQRAKKRKEDLGEAAREFVSAAWFGGRRLTATTVSRPGDRGLQVETAWTEKDVIVSAGEHKLVPVIGWGLPDWLVGLGDEREGAMRLGAQHLTGTVTVAPPAGYRASGLPADVRISEGPLQFEATWSEEAGEPRLTWSLRVAEDTVGPELGPVVSAIGAAAKRARSTQLVMERK